MTHKYCGGNLPEIHYREATEVNDIWKMKQSRNAFPKDHTAGK